MARSSRTVAVVLGLVSTLALSGCGAVSDLFGDDDNEVERDSDGNVTEPAEVDVFTLQVDDCIDGFPEGEVVDITVKPCDDPHEMEIFAGFELDDGDYPGDEEVESLADSGCADEFEPFIGITFDTSELFVSFLHPTEETWDEGDREVLCTVYELDESDNIVETTGTLEGAKR